MAVQVRNSDELKRLIVALALELVDANIAFKIHMDLISANHGEYGAAMREAWTFWSLTINHAGGDRARRILPKEAMTKWIVAALSVGLLSVHLTPAVWAAELGKPFLAHMPNGNRYWVVICVQADECFEDAFKWCEGPTSTLTINSFQRAVFDSGAKSRAITQ